MGRGYEERRRNHKMKTDYKITRDKFMDDKERDKLLKFCREIAELDLMKGRITWTVR